MTAGFIGNHLWQSSWFALFAGVLAIMLRGNSPRVRYWVWLSASLKFLVPWVLLVNLGSTVPWPGHRVGSIATPSLPDTLTQIAEPFSPNLTASVQTPGSIDWGVTALAFVWVTGFIAIAFSRWRNWHGVRSMVRAGTPVKLPIAVPALVTPGANEPGVVGFLRPVLVLPALLLERLNPKQLEALLAHELSHVRRRDNLFAALHMGVEAIFWFHPLVWWIGSRMVEERELACDEEVLRLGCEPTDYVRGILTVWQHYSEAPLPCVSGVTGADVKKRLRTILRGRLSRELNGHKRLALAFAAAAAIVVPVGVGVWNATAARAQSTAQPAARREKKPGFEVASIKPAPPDADERSLSHNPGARLSTSNATLKQLVLLAYQRMPFQVSGGPDWVESAGFDIEAKPANPKATQEEFRQMIQTLLADRFQLKFHYATKEMPVYLLTVAKNGTKLLEAKDDSPEVTMRNGRGAMTGVKATMAMFAAALSRPLQRKVVDQTGLQGAYTFELRFAPDQNPAWPNVDAATSIDGPSIFTALREQLGLTLESGKGPVEVLVIDHAEKPSPN